MTSLENDSELEREARRQAERTVEALVAAYPTAPPIAALLQKMGVGAKQAHIARLPEPGVELLMWRLKGESEPNRALLLILRILSHPDYIAMLPSGRDCPLLHYSARRKWNEAAAQWSKLNDPKATTWLRCERRLLLRRTPQAVQFVIERKDLDVQFDPVAQKLVPARQETVHPWGPKDRQSLFDWFPNLTLKGLVDGLRAPLRQLQAAPAYRNHGGADAYVHNAPLFVSNMEIFMHDKKKPVESKEDPNKGFVTWLSNTLRAANTK